MEPLHFSGEPPGVLFLDDEVNILKSLSRLFRKTPYKIYTAQTAPEAIETLRRSPIQVVVSDQRMPGTTGIRFLDQVRESWPDLIRIILTGHTDMDMAVEAVNRAEIFRLLTKPWSDDELRATIAHAIETYGMGREIERLNQITREQNDTLLGLNEALQDVNRNLERRIRERTKEVHDKHGELRRAYRSTLRALAEAIEAKDPYTRGHSERVGVYSSRIARELECENSFIERIYLAGLLHDVGKIGVPDAIIRKPGRLTQEEYEQIKRHPEIGARILEPVDFLKDIVACVRHHHEWFDGSDRGYPDRLAGDESLRRGLGEKGYRAFREKWSPEPHLRLYHDYIRSIQERKFGGSSVPA